MVPVRRRGEGGLTVRRQVRGEAGGQQVWGSQQQVDALRARGSQVRDPGPGRGPGPLPPRTQR